jgi:hypothetical protein
VSTEYRADNVAILRGADGRPVTGVIVEVQLHEHRRARGPRRESDSYGARRTLRLAEADASVVI